MTRAGVEELLTAGGIGPPPILGFGVTGALREWYAEGDEEELEYVAMDLAAQACVQLLAARTEDQVGARPRRMVLALDTDRVTPDAEHTRGSVQIDAVISSRQVAALHADTDDAADDVAAAVAVVRGGGPRDGDEQFVVDACAAHELAWFATQEIPDLL
ncbi:MAG TPA: hypothetical protein VFJ14_02650 [Nocardioidaceae bacterium]|nr:hypothetical protein [Nocardioidaceae bacterium]